ncbi:MAG: GDP-mannose 4,6-dehydratase [Candidatus Hadarchaeales archaeon]
MPKLKPLDEVMKKMDIKQKLRPLYEKNILIDDENWEDYQRTRNLKSSSPRRKFWKNKKVLVTGVGGFVGSNLVERLIELGSEVVGIVKSPELQKYPNLSDLKNSIRLHACDLMDYGHVDEIIKEEKPEILFHYAAISFVPTSLKEPNLVFQNNVGSTINLLKALSKHAGDSIQTVYTALSSEQYGYVMGVNELPIKETQPFRPTSPYSVSKIATEYIGESFFYNHGLPVLKIRTFNQEGVGNPKKMKRARDDRFFTMVVAKQIAAYQKGKSNRIIIQNPNSLRDFTHVRDSVNAHLLAAEKCEPNNPYNVCSGRGVLTGDFVKIACGLYDIPSEKIYCDVSGLRPYELYPGALIHGFVGDNSKFCQKTGWRPVLNLKDIVEESVEFQLSRKSS